VPTSYPSRGAIDCRTKDRKKPINTDAEACMPIVSVNISTERPKKKESNKTAHPGVSNGKSKINKTYMYGFK